MQQPKIGLEEVREDSNLSVRHRRKKVVVPGDLVTGQRKKLGQHVFIEDGKVYSDILGITYQDSEVAYVVALHGRYMPRRNDLVVGIVSNETVNGYMVDINSIYNSYLSKSMIREQLKKGSVISAKLGDVNEINEAGLEDVRIFYGGEIVAVSPSKVSRIIGRGGSMLSVLRTGTGCNLLVGRNGWVWVKGGNIPLLVEAIKLIEAEAHLDNLTKKVEEFLKSKKVK